MEPMAQEYAQKGFTFVFIYTREAHPGEHYPAHRSMEQKRAHARAFQKLFSVQRLILLDDLAGTADNAYGRRPNMTYLIGRGGRVLFRADWTDPPTIRAVLEYLLEARSRRQAGLHLAPFYAEFVGFRWTDQAKFREQLSLAGQQAVDDLAKAAEKRRSQGPRAGFITLE